MFETGATHLMNWSAEVGAEAERLVELINKNNLKFEAYNLDEVKERFSQHHEDFRTLRHRVSWLPIYLLHPLLTTSRLVRRDVKIDTNSISLEARHRKTS
jgi:hypothetical protein